MDGGGRVERRSLRYIRLAAYLADQPDDVTTIEMSIPEIEQLVGETLPGGARFPSWWRNDEHRAHSRAWLTAGWRVTEVEPGVPLVRFVRGSEGKRRT